MREEEHLQGRKLGGTVTDDENRWSAYSLEPEKGQRSIRFAGRTRDFKLMRVPLRERNLGKLKEQVERPKEKSLKPKTRWKDQPEWDVRAVCGESRTHGSEGGRKQECFDLSQRI